jgi:hypothetical protein
MVKLLNTAHVRAMTKALEATQLFKIEKTPETVRATTGKGKEVYAALKKGAADAWIVRHHNQLFE